MELIKIEIENYKSITAPICIAGGLCKQWLAEQGIKINAHIQMIQGIEDDEFDPVSPQFDSISTDFPVLNPQKGAQMQQAIASAKAQCDSVGGMIECAVTGLSVGIGEPMFGGVESRIAQIVYGIPAVKGVEFGAGRGFAYGTASQLNDSYTADNGQVQTVTNNAGGILGGITNGMPVIFRVIVKPTPSISQPQQSISLNKMEQRELIVKGRHDPCILPRAVPVVEAAAAIAIYDLILSNTQTDRRK